MSLQPVNSTSISVPKPISYKLFTIQRNNISKLFSIYVTPTLLSHLISTEVVMFELANHLGDSDEAERWALVGLIHDTDWDACGKDPSIHCGNQTRELLLQNQIPTEIIDDAFSHYGFVIVDGQKVGFEESGTRIEANTLLRKTLFAADELTGFINACALVRPSKSIQDLEAKSVIKKLKDKSFAAQVNRELIKTCEKTLNIPLNEFVELVLTAMKKYHQHIEFNRN